MDTETSYRSDLLLLFIAIGLFFCIGLDARPYLTPSEARYIELPRQMLATHDWLTPRIDGVPYFEKPPLFYWMQAVVMQFFGSGEFAGRFTTALLSTLTCLVTYATGRLLAGRLDGLLAAAILATSLMGYGLSRVATLDVPVSFFLTCCIASFLAAQHTEDESRKRTFYLLMYVASALAVMTKGLIGIVIPGIVIGAWIAARKRWRLLKEVHLVHGLILFLLITVPWHWMMAKTHPAFLDFYFVHEHFTRYLTDEHKRTAPWWFFIVVTWVGLLPWSFLLSFPRRRESSATRGSEEKKPFIAADAASLDSRLRGNDIFLFLWILLPLIFFSSSHSKLVPYIFPIFPPLCIIMGQKLALLCNGSLPVKSLRVHAWLAIATFVLLLASIQLLPALPGKTGQKMAAITGVVSLLSLLPIGMALVWVASRTFRGTAQQLTVAMAGLGMIVGLSANYLAASFDKQTIKPLAESLAQRLKQDDLVMGYGSYWQDLPVYLNRNVAIAGWTGELSFGFEHYPEAHQWMISEDEFWQRCSASPFNVFVFIHEDAAKNLPAHNGCPLRIIGQYGNTLLMEKTTSVTKP